MLLDLKITFKDEDGDTITYEFGTLYYSQKEKSLVNVGGSHSEILAIKSKIIELIEPLF